MRCDVHLSGSPEVPHRARLAACGYLSHSKFRIILASLEGFEPSCVQLAFQRFRRPRAYSDMREPHKCEREGCEEQTHNARFCTRRCAVTVNNKVPKRKTKVHICACGNVQRRRECRDCVLQRRSRVRQALDARTLQSFVEKNAKNHPSWKYAEVRSHCRSTNRHLAKRCQVCGYDKHVELAHVVALHLWPSSATLREVNHENNVLVLCRNHHWEFDHGLIELSDVPSRQDSNLRPAVS